jgi:hypothetical protein
MAVSAEYNLMRESKNVVAIYLLHIHFEAFFDIPAKDFYFSSTKGVTEFPINNVVQEFQGTLSAIPNGRHQREARNDFADFSLANPENVTYADFVAYEDIIERGEVTIFECLELGKDYYEGETRFVGYLKDFTFNEAETSLDFTCVSDMSRTGYAVGARILTRERCGTLFNYGGTNPPEFHFCGWQLAQGGNPNNCTHYLKGVDGCVAHGNAHRFFAVPALSVAEITFVQSGEVDFPYNSDSACFGESTYIILPDWSIKPMHEHREGEIIAYDIFTGEFVVTEIVAFEEHSVNKVLLAEFEHGTLETRREHLFNTEKTKYLPVGALEGKTVVGFDSERKHAQNALIRLTEVFEPQMVCNYQTKSFTILVTDAKMSFLWKVHNNKQTPINY